MHGWLAAFVNRAYSLKVVRRRFLDIVVSPTLLMRCTTIRELDHVEQTNTTELQRDAAPAKSTS
jgi:hypothetical protein